MRIAHITDLHVERRPTLGELANKRLLGAVNLYVLGRSHHFSVASQEAAVAAVRALSPDAVLCTGDLTATATEAEFEASVALVRPLTESGPFLTIPGNHDVYTGESVGRFARHYGAWSNGGRFPFLQPVGPVDVLALDVSRAGWLSNGLAPEEQLVEAERLLASGDRPVVVMIHYPLRGRGGDPYGPGTRNIVNAAAIEAVLVRQPRVRAILHGHEHHGFRTELPREGGAIPIYNPGATGYAHLPERRRTAHFNVYEVDATGIVGVERYAWDGERFAPETGGAYATGG